jgi:hypothetical protein
LNLRREAPLGDAVAAVASGSARAIVAPAGVGASESEIALAPWHHQPTAAWTEALPIGKGRVGAMVFGEPRVERLQLNEDALWSGGPRDPVNPEARASLDGVRKLIFEQWAAAQRLADETLMARPLRQMAYQALGSLSIEQEGLPCIADAFPRWTHYRFARPRRVRSRCGVAQSRLERACVRALAGEPVMVRYGALECPLASQRGYETY